MTRRRLSGLIGYFDVCDRDQTTPTYDPSPHCQCLVCMRTLCPPMVTVSLMPKGGRRSLFFRAHKVCWESLSDDGQRTYEGSIIDLEVEIEARRLLPEGSEGGKDDPTKT